MPRAKHGPEWFIQEDLRVFLDIRGWMVQRMIGNALQWGIPDLYIAHPYYGQRWVDVKQPKGYSFTPAQASKWPKWSDQFKIGIWILTAATEEEYAKLMGPPNWRDYWDDKWAVPDIDGEIDEIAKEAKQMAMPRNSIRNGRGRRSKRVPHDLRP
jgi:hypothetical protein